jgi:hypothetical protein
VNQEIYDNFGFPDLVTVIQVCGLEWLWDGVRMNGEGAVKKLWKGIPEGRRIKGRPKLRWMDNVEFYMKCAGVNIRRPGTSDRKKRHLSWGKPRAKFKVL